MATIKSYTDLEQSKKLAEILPIESADMHYEYIGIPVVNVGTPNYNENGQIIPCWSLAALLDIIPKRIKDYNILGIDIGENDTNIWYDEIGCGVSNDLPDITKESAVDACYEMVIKLHELNLL